MYLPLHNISRKNFLSVPKICFFTVSLPLFAFLTCVLMTMVKDFENANHTHCDVPNIFPSISATIGNYEPQSTIWKTAIYVHAPLRLLLINLRWDHFKKIIREDCRFLVNVAVLLNAIENLALLGLTYWNSIDFYPYHEVSFKTFIATSILYMLIINLLITKCRRRPSVTKSEFFSVKWKWRAFFVNAGSFAFAAYFFLRHNKFCEPYIYSLFGFSEYIVVISNIVYHATTAYDLPRSNVYFTWRGLEIK